MCVFSNYIRNKKYEKGSKDYKNGVDIGKMKWIETKCGECIECRRERANEWRVRLTEEIKGDKRGRFTTLTFKEEELEKLCKIAKTRDAVKVPALAIKRFRERWRAEYKEKIKYWLITELGHEGTERIHLHGILFTDKEEEEIERRWKYGKVDFGRREPMDGKGINYMVKYVTKPDKDHKGFKGRIFTSRNIGEGFGGDNWDSRQRDFKGENTIQYYRMPDGTKIAMPRYMRNKKWKEAEREFLWEKSLNKNKKYVMGEEVDVSTEQGAREYEKMKTYWANKSREMGLYPSKERKKQWKVKKEE